MGDGNSKKIWHDKWVPKPPTYVANSSIATVDDARVAVLIDSGKWNEGAVHDILYANYCKLILDVHLPKVSQPDGLVWPHIVDGNLTANSAYLEALVVYFEFCCCTKY